MSPGKVLSGPVTATPEATRPYVGAADLKLWQQRREVGGQHPAGAGTGGGNAGEPAASPQLGDGVARDQLRPAEQQIRQQQRPAPHLQQFIAVMLSVHMQAGGTCLPGRRSVPAAAACADGIPMKVGQHGTGLLGCTHLPAC